MFRYQYSPVRINGSLFPHQQPLFHRQNSHFVELPFSQKLVYVQTSQQKLPFSSKTPFSKLVSAYIGIGTPPFRAKSGEIKGGSYTSVILFLYIYILARTLTSIRLNWILRPKKVLVIVYRSERS